MPSVPDKIREIAETFTAPIGAYVVDVVFRGERSSKVIEVYVDTDAGITLEQCSDISRLLSEWLDANELIDGRYRLDVSSPGLDRPLRLHRQYVKNIGRKCAVKYTGEGKKVLLEGILEQVTADSITVVKNKKETVIPFESIVETMVVPLI